MRIAIPYIKGQIEEEFDVAQVFKFYETDGQEEGAEVIRHYLLPVEGEGWQARVDLLQEAGAELLLCDVISFEARMALRQAGFRIYSGQHGQADPLVRQLLDGELFYYSAGMCTGGCD